MHWAAYSAFSVERGKYKYNNKREIVVKINRSSKGGETNEMFCSCGWGTLPLKPVPHPWANNASLSSKVIKRGKYKYNNEREIENKQEFKRWRNR